MQNDVLLVDGSMSSHCSSSLLYYAVLGAWPRNRQTDPTHFCNHSHDVALLEQQYFILSLP